MTTVNATVRPSPSTRDLVRQLGRTIRWAPAPLWGRTAGERGRYVAYLGGSILGWTLAGLAMAALLARALGVAG
jgi:hypothetical protein